MASWISLEFDIFRYVSISLTRFGHNLDTTPYGIFPVGPASLDETECPPYRRPFCRLWRFDPAFNII